ncbi:MAG: Gfo/Idh/MocA family oxidoreductase, partial [Gammaproteobacteria bacterium]
MIIVDKALQKRHDQGRPIRVGMVGAGYMARGIALQIESTMKGMRLAGVAARNAAQAEDLYAQIGVTAQRATDSLSSIEQAIAAGHPVVTDDPMLLCRAGGIDAIIDSTGDVEVGAHVAFEAIRNGKHVILMNA